VREKDREEQIGVSLDVVPLYLADRNAPGIGLRVAWE
jgi:hypothetical protein